MKINKFLVVTWSLCVLSTVGTILNAEANIICFPIWIVANTGWIIVNFYKKIYAQAFLYLMYNLIAVYGIGQWVGKGFN